MTKLILAAVAALGVTFGAAATQAQAGWWHTSHHYSWHWHR
jgi:Spy/CpxP family protein refolding chaperone